MHTPPPSPPRWLVFLMLLSTCLTGTTPITFATAHAGETSVPPVVADLPAAIDLRPVFRNWGLARRPQGGRGTCSVFTVVGGLEYALANQSRRGTPLSVEFLNWASNQATTNQADGGFFSDLWTGFLAHGICAEADLPYRPSYDAAMKPDPAARDAARSRRDAGLRWHWIKPWDVTTGLTDAEFTGIKRTLAAQWPVCGGFRWPKREQWQDGLLAMVPPEAVFDGHSVLLVGYRDDAAAPGGGVFLIRNSGGGEPDGALSYAYVRAYMNDAGWIESGSTTVQPAETATERVRSWLNPMSPPPVGRNHRVSSNQQPAWHTENLDMTWLQPGQVLALPVFEGPGVITHLWFTSHAGWVGELNALVLRIYWDGAPEPGVEVPLADFFAVGQGRPASVESLPVQVSPTGSLSCFWRMPFAHSARLEITNDNPDRSTGLYWQVDWVTVDRLPDNTPHFHARYRQEYPARAGRDYRVADLEGTGDYIGTVLSVTLAQDGWFGEGDDFFYIDGEQVPSLQGTGSEDYFNDAWGFRARTGPWFGQPRWQGDAAGDSGVAYRWHWPDAVHFERALRFDLEHKGNRDEDTEGFFLERPDFLSSVAFWYQTGTPKGWEPLPPWPQRRVPWERHHFVQAFRQVRASGAAKPRVETTGFFGARPVLGWNPKGTSETLTLPFSVATAGRRAVRLTAGRGPEGGRYRVALDGGPWQVIDLGALEAAEADLALGTHDLAAGEHRIQFRPATPGKPAPLTIEMLRTLPLPPEARRDVKTHHEAHFVRLAIGRAVYAYRLAYDRLPGSLDELVRSGILPARFTMDENRRPLRARVDGDAFVVESDGPEPWTHRWRGLDARR